MQRPTALFACAVLTLISCAGEGTNENGKSPAANRELTVKVTLSSPPVEGDLGAFDIAIRNGMPYYAILKDLAATDGNTIAITWQFSPKGSLEFNSAADYWGYTRAGPGTAPALLNRGFLVPGERIVVRVRHRLLRLPLRFSLRYFAYRPEDIGSQVYFEKKVEKDIRFVRLAGRDLEVALTKDVASDVSSHRTVLFPYAERLEAPPLSRPLEFTAELIPRPFTAAQAAAKAGLAAVDETTFCSTLDAWVLRSGKKAWVVSKTSTLALPEIVSLERVFHIVDAVPTSILEVEFPPALAPFLPKNYKLAADRAKNRLYLFLDKRDLADFLGEFAKAPGASIDAVMEADGAGRLVVRKN